VTMAFSTSTWLPVAVAVFYGVLKETKVFKYFVERFPGVDLGFVMDRGFKSHKLLSELKTKLIYYVAALMKNSKLLPASGKMIGIFEYGAKRLLVFCKKSKRPFGFFVSL